MVYTLRFFSSKCSFFHDSNVFGSCIIHILYTGCAKIKKNNSGAKMLIRSWTPDDCLFKLLQHNTKSMETIKSITKNINTTVSRSNIDENLI